MKNCTNGCVLSEICGLDSVSILREDLRLIVRVDLKYKRKGKYLLRRAIPLTVCLILFKKYATLRLHMREITSC